MVLFGRWGRLFTTGGILMNRNIIAYSEQASAFAAFEEITDQIFSASQGQVPEVIFFTAPVSSFEEFSKLLYGKYPDSIVCGSTSYIGFSNKGFSKTAISVSAIMNNVECSCGVIKNIRRNPMAYSDTIFKSLHSLSSTGNTCCVEFTTAFSGSEELVQDTFKSVLSEFNVPVFGGTAGAGRDQTTTYVSLNGEIYEEACVFVFIRNLHGRILIYRENMFKPTPHVFTATDVDCDDRAVYEYNHRSAAGVIAEALRIPLNDLQSELNMHPIGRIEGDRISITEVDRIHPDGHITYYSRIYNQTRCVQLEMEDLNMVWARTQGIIKTAMPSPSFMLVVNCLSRSRYFLKENRFEEFNNVLSSYTSFIGLSGYGEQSDYTHLNQTMLLAVFE